MRQTNKRIKDVRQKEPEGRHVCPFVFLLNVRVKNKEKRWVQWEQDDLMSL